MKVMLVKGPVRFSVRSVNTVLEWAALAFSRHRVIVPAGCCYGSPGRGAKAFSNKEFWKARRLQRECFKWLRGALDSDDGREATKHRYWRWFPLSGGYGALVFGDSEREICDEAARFYGYQHYGDFTMHQYRGEAYVREYRMRDGMMLNSEEFHCIIEHRSDEIDYDAVARRSNGRYTSRHARYQAKEIHASFNHWATTISEAISIEPEDVLCEWSEDSDILRVAVFL